jgi:mRNA interferase HicA
VRRGERLAALPRHGGSKQLGTGLIESVKKDLGL